MTLPAFILAVPAVWYVVGYSKVSLPFRRVCAILAQPPADIPPTREAWRARFAGRTGAAVAMTLTVVGAALTRGILVLIECSACAGFWIGAGLGWTGAAPFGPAADTSVALTSGLAGTTVTFLWASLCGIGEGARGGPETP